MKNPTTTRKNEGFVHSKNTQKLVTKKRQPKYHALDIYIAFCFGCIIVYTIAHTWIFYKIGVEAKVLDALFYGVFGGECLICALIKRHKLKNELALKLNSKTPEPEEEEEVIELAEDRYEL